MWRRKNSAQYIHFDWYQEDQTNCITNLKRQWRWDIIPALKGFSMIWHSVINWNFQTQLLKYGMLFCLVMVPICWMLCKIGKGTERKEKEGSRGKRKRTVKLKKRENLTEKWRERIWFYWRFGKIGWNWIVGS